MKIRNGFVSNSSSTSFCIFGIELNKIKNVGYDGDLYDFVESEYNTENPTPLEYATGLENYSGSIIGVSPDEIKEDETFGQFKARVSTRLAEVLNVDVSQIKPVYSIDGGYEC